MDSIVEFNIIKNNTITDYGLDVDRVAGYGLHTRYTTWLSLDDLDNGEQIIIVEPYEVVKDKINKVLDRKGNK